MFSRVAKGKPTDLILVKIFSTALALSEVMTQPQAVKTHFDAVADQDKVVQTLRAGCAHMRRAFDIELINVDELISTALNDQKAVGTGIKAFHGINFADLNVAYHRFCKNENVGDTVVDLRQVIEFFNDAAADLPDHARLKGRKLPSMTAILDGKGANFADVFEPSNRRIWVSLDDIPESVQKAFVAAEDRRFYQHHGVDERGIIRAFMGNLGESGRPQGGSTITQQVVKNLLVGEDVTYERKIREIIVASRVESTLTKAEIFELYLNSAYLGRSSWGVETPPGAISANRPRRSPLARGPCWRVSSRDRTSSNPDRRPERAKERLAYVLGRMQEDDVISPEQRAEALAAPPKIVALDRQRRDTGFHFVDFLGREAKADGIESLTAQPYTVHSTINATLQRDTKPRCRKDWRTTRSKTGACSSMVRKRTLPTRCKSFLPGTTAGRRAPPPTPRRGQRRPGSRRSRTFTCPSTTSIGSLRSFSRAGSAATRRSALV